MRRVNLPKVRLRYCIAHLRHYPDPFSRNIYCDVPGSFCLSKKGESDVRFVSFLNFLSGPPVDGPKDPWPRVLLLPERFVGDPASPAHDKTHMI